MVRTRFSTPEIAIDDPVVEIHESQLKRLRARANLALPSAIVGVVALALIGAGIVRVEKSVRAIDALAQGRTGVLAEQVSVLGGQLASRTDPGLIARIATEANAEPIAGASTMARQALSVARKTAASVEPVTEQLALVDGKLVRMNSEIANLSGQETTHAAQLAEVSLGVESLRASQEKRLDTLTRQFAAHGTRFDLQDEEVKSAKTLSRVATAGAAIGIGVAAVHVLGHGSR